MCICQELKLEEEKLISEGAWVDLFIYRDKHDYYYITAISDGRADIKIKYCPMCGRRLLED